MISAEQCSIVRKMKQETSLNRPFKLSEKNAHLFVLEAHDLYYRERSFLDRIELLNVEQSVNTYDILVKAQYKDKENIIKNYLGLSRT